MLFLGTISVCGQNVVFTNLQLRHNQIVDGKKMLQMWFNCTINGIQGHDVAAILSVESPKGTYHKYANGSDMVFENPNSTRMGWPSTNLMGQWLGIYNDVLNPKPGNNEYLARICIKDLTTGRIIGRSNYLTFSMTGEQHVQQHADNAEQPLGKNNLYQDNILAAHRGDCEAQSRVGVAYVFGDGVSVNYAEAVSWFRKSAEQGCAVGQYQLGFCYDNGKGVSEDKAQAVKWYSKAANQGHIQAQADLAKCYFGGVGVEKDYSKGIAWARKAAEQGDLDSYYLIGWSYAEGVGVEQDFKTAVSWFQKAAGKGHVGAQAYLGYCYYMGFGVEKDEGKGVSWLQKAADQGEHQSKDMLARIEEEKKKAELESNKEPPIDVDINIPSSSIRDHNTFAVIIGNEKYKNVDEVPFAENDARVFREYVKQLLGVPETQIMYVENGSYNDIRQAVNWLSQAMQVFRGQGRAIFYYAGHGIPSEHDQTAYLLPTDGIGNDIESAYSLKSLFETLGKTDAKNVTVFLDACFSGTKREGDMIVKARGVAIKTKPATPEGKMIVFSAAQNDETAYPYKKMKHGMFTYYLLKKLQESCGEATYGELDSYVTDQVVRQSFIENKKIQTPTVKASMSLGDGWKNMKLK